MIKKGFMPKTVPGRPLPLGANFHNGGVQFSIISRYAQSVDLLLFYDEKPDSAYLTINLDNVKNRTGDIWHIWIDEIDEGQLYGYRMDGKYDPENGYRFNKNMMLIDPYARAISGNFIWDFTKSRGYDHTSEKKDLQIRETENINYVPRSIVIKEQMDTEDAPINIRPRDTIIYELHVKGFTIDDSANVPNPGTFRGLIEKIPYLKDLGITSVELMPVQEFDEYENININPETGERLKNYWGYSTLAFLAPNNNYSSSGTMGQQVTEFREMVKSLHSAGIEVILDIVFNHTCEGDQNGPTLSFRGIDNQIYYILENNKRYYQNYSGCGNTFNCNHPVVRDFILSCLRYWVIEMRVDGFRFDLASILGRDENGSILNNPPLIDIIEEDPILRNTKIIAEAWDAAGAYQLGKFPGRWAEWNGKYRDDVRRFWRGDPMSRGDFATRITGSSDLYDNGGRGPYQSINFVTCHDGFTLSDLVSFNYKHNLSNGENNRDGDNNNISHNFGIEGTETTPYIESMRLRQIKNFLATLMLSQGIPMMLAGDEFRRTQKGNNNAYCQDNEISWINWELLERNKELFAFTSKMINFRKKHQILRMNSYFKGYAHEGFTVSDISWYDFDGKEPDWKADSHTIALLLNGDYANIHETGRDEDIYMIFNSSMLSRMFAVPMAPSGRKWRIFADTSRLELDGEHYDKFHLQENRIYVQKKSTVVLVADG